jgi:hypothetical protein
MKMDIRDYARYDLFEIDRKARELRAEATRDAFKSLTAWLRRPWIAAKPARSHA